jgi:hypothetical protein
MKPQGKQTASARPTASALPTASIALAEGGKAALSRSGLKKKALLRHLSSPWVLGPFLVGLTTLAAIWTFSVRSGIGVFAGIACVLGAMGAFLTRLVLGSESVAKESLEELRHEVQEEREKALDQLDRDLTADGDPRTEGCLRDLRALTKAFQECQTWSSELNTNVIFDVLAGVDRLFQRCVESLEKTLALYHTARQMSTPQAREKILGQRERIIADVGESTKQLSDILGGLMNLGAASDEDGSDLARVRAELDRSLEVARTVEKRMHRLEQEVGGMDHE